MIYKKGRLQRSSFFFVGKKKQLIFKNYFIVSGKIVYL